MQIFMLFLYSVLRHFNFIATSSRNVLEFGTPKLPLPNVQLFVELGIESNDSSLPLIEQWEGSCDGFDVVSAFIEYNRREDLFAVFGDEGEAALLLNLHSEEEMFGFLGLFLFYYRGELFQVVRAEAPMHLHNLFHKGLEFDDVE